MSCLFEPIHGRFPTHSICDHYPDCVGCSYSDKEKPKTFCDTCGHQFSDVCGGCETLDGVPVKYKRKTNADRIRAMSDEELADFICKTNFAFIPRSLGNIPISVYDGMSVLKWLKQEVSDDT